MFTKNLRFFGQILHPQWPTQTQKMGQKNGLRPLGVKYWDPGLNFYTYSVGGQGLLPYKLGSFDEMQSAAGIICSIWHVQWGNRKYQATQSHLQPERPGGNTSAGSAICNFHPGNNDLSAPEKHLTA
jgi:hypothetical protein